jgi:UDP-3-O-[3-hydroxymyristoyl] glucosamine N-acyltransferase
MAGPFTVEELAEQLGGVVEGDGRIELVDVRGLEEAGPEHLSFLSNRKYVRQLADSQAGAVLIDRETDPRGHTVIRCEDPYIAFARALALFHPVAWPEPGVDAQAWVAPGVELEGVTVEAFAWIGPGAEIDPGTWIQSGASVGAGARIGRDCRLMPHSVVCEGSVLGDRVWLNPGVVIGGEGFGFAPSAKGHVKIPQIGRAVVGDDVEIGANSCVDRGALGDTVVASGCKLDNFVQIGHGASIGEGCLLVSYVGIAGSARVGRNVIMAGKSGVINHLRVGDGVQVGVHGIVTRDQPAGVHLAGTPAIDHRQWLRASAAFAELPALVRRVRALEARLAELEGRAGEPASSS